MEVFTDGSEALEEPEQVFDNSDSGDSSTSEPETTETEENETTTLSPSPDTQEEKKQDYYTSYQNMSFTMIVGIGLLFGCVCALILSNYLRHG